MKLKDIKNQTPPKMLYHYTSQEGLIGILKSRCIWASKVHYMNDSQEFSMALDLARGELKNRLDAERDKNVRARLEEFLYDIKTIEPVNMCVCSFSGAPDSLSQWRAYSGEGPGFSLGFSHEKLSKVAKNSAFSLHECVYHPDCQKNAINTLINETLATPVDPGSGAGLLGTFGNQMAMLAPLIKDISFKDEEEWRLISEPPINFTSLDHRPGRSMITPFFRLVIGTDNGFDCLAEVVVGPTPHPELSKASVESLLSAAGLRQGTVVRITTVPFRNW